MAPNAQEHAFLRDAVEDFRLKTTMWIAGSGLLFVAPFGINNIVQGRTLLGLCASTVVIVLSLLAWNSYQGRYSNISLLLFPPVLLFLTLSIQQQGIIGVMWTYPTVVSFYFIFRERWAWTANVLTLAVVVPLSSSVLEPAIALRALVTLTLISVFAILGVRVISLQQQRLEKMAVTDSLTGLYNRILLTTSLDHSLERHRNNDEAAALLAIDVDHFKNINDTYGHQTGDGVLAGVAEVLVRRLRSTDVLFRAGGEEFSVVLPDTHSEPSGHVAQLLRSAIAGENLIDTHQVTVSVGVAMARADDTPEMWLARADRCLYEAKRQGRNRVVTDSVFDASALRRRVAPAW